MKRRLSELRDDLELMLKSELMGRLGYLEAQIGHRFDELSDRISELEGNGGPTMHKPGSCFPNAMTPTSILVLPTASCELP